MEKLLKSKGFPLVMVKNPQLELLEKSWDSSGKQLGLPDELMAGILFGINEGQLRFINLDRLLFNLENFNEIKGLLEDQVNTETAFWFTNLDYSLGPSDYLSDLVNNKLVEYIDGKSLERITSLIKSVSRMPYDADSKLLFDVNIAFLGLKWNRFVKEYHSLERDFDKESVHNHIDRLLSQERVFYSDYFSEKYAVGARDNYETLKLVGRPA